MGQGRPQSQPGHLGEEENLPPKKLNPAHIKYERKILKSIVKAIQQQHESMFNRRIFSCKEKTKEKDAAYITLSHRRQYTKQKNRKN
jgi:hypothetical protein